MSIDKRLSQKLFQDCYSNGCQACQNGRWLCIYLTYRCGAECVFCPTSYKDKIVSAFGDDPQIILEYMNKSQFKGVSFSGGDCFLVFDKLIEWLTFFKKHRPDIYYWAYTNGLSVKEQQLKQLAACGLHELRFNIAATGYASPRILNILSTAVRLIDHVAVEIPSIPQDYEKLIAVLPRLDCMNVQYLNLHEYLLMPGDPYSKNAASGTFIFNKHSKIKYDAYSLQNTEKVKRFCKKNNLNLRINNCSLQKKENQMLHRRLVMGKLVKKTYERLTDEGLLQTVFTTPQKLNTLEVEALWQSKNGDRTFEHHFIHPEKASFYKCKKTAGTVVRLTFVPPMTLEKKRVLIKTEIENNSTKGIG